MAPPSRPSSSSMCPAPAPADLPSHPHPHPHRNLLHVLLSATLLLLLASPPPAALAQIAPAFQPQTHSAFFRPANGASATVGPTAAAQQLTTATGTVSSLTATLEGACNATAERLDAALPAGSPLAAIWTPPSATLTLAAAVPVPVATALQALAALVYTHADYQPCSPLQRTVTVRAFDAAGRPTPTPLTIIVLFVFASPAIRITLASGAQASAATSTPIASPAFVDSSLDPSPLLPPNASAAIILDPQLRDHTLQTLVVSLSFAADSPSLETVFLLLSELSSSQHAGCLNQTVASTVATSLTASTTTFSLLPTAPPACRDAAVFAEMVRLLAYSNAADEPTDAATPRRITLRVTDAARSSALVVFSQPIALLNEFSPVFLPLPTNTTLAENTPAPAPLLTVVANDADVGADGTLAYAVISVDPPSVPVTINATTGALVVASPIDRERVPAFNVTVSATDGGSPARSAYATLPVTVLDADDNPPRYIRRRFHIYLASPTPPQTVLAQPTAVDRDAPSNARAHYSLDPSPPPFLALNSSSALITAATVLSTSDSNSSSTNVFVDPDVGFAPYTIHARRASTPTSPTSSSAALFFFFYTNTTTAPAILLNPLPPATTASSSMVLPLLQQRDHALAPLTAQLTFRGTDSDTLDLVTIELLDALGDPLPAAAYASEALSISSGRTQASFEYNATSGILAITPRPPTLLQASDVTLAVQTLVYTNANPSPPSSSTQRRTLRLTSYPVTGLDRDRATRDLFLNLYPFLLRLNTTSIRTSILENVSPPTVAATVRAGFRGELQALVDAGTAYPASSVAIAYTLLSAQPSAGAFAVDPATGAVRTTQPLDREAAAEHRLVVRAALSAFPAITADASIVVTVLDQNDNVPAFVPSSLAGLAVHERLPAGTLVAQLQATDADLDSSSLRFRHLRYSLQAQTGCGCLVLDPRTGRLTTSRPLDFEAFPFPNPLPITVTVTDGNFTTTANTSVALLDANDPPSALLLNPASPAFQPAPASGDALAIPEDLVGSALSVIGSLVVVDADLDDPVSTPPAARRNESHTFALLDSSGGRFVLVNNSFLALAPSPTQLDFESEPTVAVTVRVLDAAGALLDRTFTLAVTDANDAPSAPTLTANTVSEGSLLPATIGTLQAADADAGQTLSFVLLADPSNLVRLGGPRNATLSLVAPVSFETQPLFSVTVAAVDSGSPPLSSPPTTLDIRVLDANDAPERIQLVPNQPNTTITFPESTAPNTVVAVVVAGDQDLSLLTLAIEANLTAAGRGGLFRLGTTACGTLAAAQAAVMALAPTLAASPPATPAQVAIPFARSYCWASLVLARAVDFERTPLTTLAVTARDSGGLSTTNILELGVADANDEPTAQLSAAPVPETAQAPLAVGTVEVRDPDAGQTLTCLVSPPLLNLTLASVSYGPVDRRPSVFTYTLVLADAERLRLEPLDFETRPLVPLVVFCYDDGQPLSRSTQVRFNLEVADVNEPPVAVVVVAGNDGSTALRLREDANAGDLVGVVEGLDLDAGDDVRLELQTEAGAQVLFEVAMINGTGTGASADGRGLARLLVRSDLGTGPFAAFDVELIAPPTGIFSVSINVSVCAIDRAGLQLCRELEVELVDVNEPVQELALVLPLGAVPEDAAPGSVVGELRLTDADRVGAFLPPLPSLVGAGAAYFRVGAGRVADAASHTYSYEVILTAPLDYEAEAVIDLQVDVVELGVPTQRFNVTAVAVQNVNEAPGDIELISTADGQAVTSIAEGSAGVLGLVRVVDEDAGDTHTLALLGASSAAQLQLQGAAVVLLQQLDYETLALAASSPMPNISFTLSAVDAGGLNLTRTLTLPITNVNEAPKAAFADHAVNPGCADQLDGSLACSVSESLPAGTVLAEVEYSDPDLGETDEAEVVVALDPSLAGYPSVSTAAEAGIGVVGMACVGDDATPATRRNCTVQIGILTTLDYEQLLAAFGSAALPLVISVRDQRNASSALLSLRLVVADANDRPVVLLDGETASNRSLAFVEESAPTAIAPVLAIADADAGAMVLSASVALLSAPDGQLEGLAVGNLGSGLTVRLADGNTLQGYRITGRGTAARYASVLRSILYFNGHTEPTLGLRQLRVVVVDDAGSESAPAFVEIEVLGINDNRPRLPAANLFAEVAEAVPANTSVVTVGSSDLDSGAAFRGRRLFTMHRADLERYLPSDVEVGALELGLEADALFGMGPEADGEVRLRSRIGGVCDVDVPYRLSVYEVVDGVPVLGDTAILTIGTVQTDEDDDDDDGDAVLRTTTSGLSAACYGGPVDGRDYRGTVGRTVSGRTCQSWTAQQPHSHVRTPANFPDAGLGAHRFCRNPDRSPSPWCFTTDPAVEWEPCDVCAGLVAGPTAAPTLAPTIFQTDPYVCAGGETSAGDGCRCADPACFACENAGTNSTCLLCGGDRYLVEVGAEVVAAAAAVEGGVCIDNCTLTGVLASTTGANSNTTASTELVVEAVGGGVFGRQCVVSLAPDGDSSDNMNRTTAAPTVAPTPTPTAAPTTASPTTEPLLLCFLGSVESSGARCDCPDGCAACEVLASEGFSDDVCILCGGALYLTPNATCATDCSAFPSTAESGSATFGRFCA